MEFKKPTFDRTITIEFYIDSDKSLKLIYNNERLPFTKFWKETEGARDTCRYIFEEFKRQFPRKFTDADIRSKDWEETFLKIINNHLGLYDTIMDVFIRTNGEVIFKLER